MKYFFVLTVAILTALSFGQTSTNNACAPISGKSYDADTVFISTINEILEDEQKNDVKIVAEKEVVYDINLSPLGLEYIFNVDETAGYAIVLQIGEEFIVPEIFLDAKDPYKEIPTDNCIRIYLNTLSYLYYEEDTYFVPETRIALNDALLEKVYGGAIRASGNTSYATESISYTYRHENNAEIIKRHPAYYADASMQNACAAVAGTTVISYYDRYYDLIPNYSPGTKIGTVYLYKEQNENVVSVMSQLDANMQNDGSGTTLNQFKAGMTKYVNAKGFSIIYESCAANGNLDLLNVKENIEEEKPIVIFLSGYNLAKISAETNSDSINYKIIDANHVMVCFGIKEISYQLANGDIRINTYVQVATGLQSQARGYYQMDYNGRIDQALAISIQ